MNEEEKKAIERLEEQLNFWKKQNIKNSDCEIILNLITKLQKENEEKDKQIDILKNHIHYKKCKNCGQEFRAKRTDAQYCKKCSTKVNNGNYYKNLSPEQKQKRREQSKLYMRKLRERRKNGTNK